MGEEVNSTQVAVELLRKHDRPGPRYTSYPTAPIWTEEVGVDAYQDALKAASKQTDESIALYCHIPFCHSRCFYCGCNTCIIKETARVNEYVDRLIEEIDNTAALLGERHLGSQLHFGGGTPTFLTIHQLGRILDQLDQRFDWTGDVEKSIEIDPRVTTLEQIDFLAERGFNRLSLGVQDLDPEVQTAIGRPQPEKMVVRMLEHGRKLGFKGINFDLIYGLPKQTPESFRRTLDRVIELRPDRLAVYSFAFLPNVKSNQMKISDADLPSTEQKYELFATAVEKFTAAGYRQIGMDHFALPTDELSVAQADGRLHRNFMGYTVQSSPEMIGFGMSSIGYVNDAFFQNHSKLNGYKEAVRETGFATYRGMRLSDDDLIRQYVIASLMCNFRLDYAALQQRFNTTYEEYFGEDHKALEPYFADHFIEETDTGLRVTPVGRTFVRNIAMAYDAYLKGGRKGQKATYSRTI